MLKGIECANITEFKAKPELDVSCSLLCLYLKTITFGKNLQNNENPEGLWEKSLNEAMG